MAVYLHGEGAPVSLLANTQTPIVLQPGASVPHLQAMLESLARLVPVAGPALLPWAIGELSPGNTVLLATSDIATDLDRSVAELEHTGSKVLLLLATNQSRRRPRGALTITPDCDLAARLEGRG